MTEDYYISQYSALLSELFRKNDMEMCADDNICSRLSLFCEYLLEQNRLFNLTGIKTPESAALLHFADSLLLSRFLPAGSCLLDIGSGAGFPAVPIAVARPDITVTALDSTQKRIDFINRAAEMLGLTNITAVCSRAEDVTGCKFKECFDVVTARAVAPYPILLELALPAVKVGGCFLAMKSKDVSRETFGVASVLKPLAISKPAVHTAELSDGDECIERCIVSVTKLASTPKKYPRQYAQIKKKPLF